MTATTSQPCLPPAGSSSRRPAVTGVTVVVPANNEQDTLGATLQHLDVAAARLRSSRPQLSVRVLVVLDSCTDASGELARAHGCDTLTVRLRNVGAARRAGVDRALEGHRDGGAAELWIACTDADTLVPPHWLEEHVRCADSGADVLLGTVVPDNRLDPASMRVWLARHDLREDHGHVHGANLGMRASAYLAAGGFAPLPAHEDVDLVERLRGLPWVVVRATDRHRAVTSSRLEGRAPAGFAHHLRSLRRPR